MLMFVGVISYAQQYQWTGASGDIDFFNELNWKDTSTSEIPSNNSINPGENIEFELFISCEVSAENEIILGENGRITIINGELSGDSINGLGSIILGESSYLNLENSYPLHEGLSIIFESNKSWIRLLNVEPKTAYYYYNDTQQRLAKLRDNNAKLEVANKQNQETIKMMKENYEKQTKLNNELSAKLKDAEVYGNELRKKLSKIDLPAASLNRPEETEKRINDASQKVLDILESITARKSK